MLGSTGFRSSFTNTRATYLANTGGRSALHSCATSMGVFSRKSFSWVKASGHSFGTPDPLPCAAVIWEFKAQMAAPIVQMWYVKSPGSDILTARRSPTSWSNPVMLSWLMWSVGSLCRSRISRMKKKSFFCDRLWIFLIVALLSMETHISCTAAEATGSPLSKES